MATLPNRVRYLVFDAFMLPGMLRAAFSDQPNEHRYHIDGLPEDARVVWARPHFSGMIGPQTKLEIGVASEEFADVPYGSEPKMDVTVTELGRNP